MESNMHAQFSLILAPIFLRQALGQREYITEEHGQTKRRTIFYARI
jgi:hypothetical protein